MKPGDTQGNIASAANRMESKLGSNNASHKTQHKAQHKAQYKGRELPEITDADYRSIFLPCEALDEKKERPD